MSNPLPSNYTQLLDELKANIRQARLRATVAANAELLQLYWQIGKQTLTQQEQAQWGDKITAQLAVDLQSEFPTMKGLSHRNIKYMRQFAVAYTDFSIGQRPVAQLSWSHHIILMDKLTQPEERQF
ncbi:DUF1016 N-terminal domain-containing protein [uncultured Fibrella sp.]|uniref:DUF1016 N-terminal domain-containing protein n=1 Tax=uncultured Fibrella sp. TaxID=1284596 RepID=UPI0035CB80AE